MKLALKILGGLVLLVVLLVGGYVAYIQATWDKDYSGVEKPAIKASTDPEVIKRGEYIAHSVAHCSVCHAPEDVTMKRQPGEHPPMVGGFEWKMGPIGTLYSRNITTDPETGIGKWTDEELARAIKWGVDKNGKSLTFMTFSVPAMSDEDLVAVVSYLRTTPAVKQQNKPHDVGVLGKWMATMATPEYRKMIMGELAKYVPDNGSPSIERGSYIANGPAACFGCHTPFDMMSMKPKGPKFSGSSDAEPDPKDETMVFRMPNLTPDPKTGHMANWDEEHFVQRFKNGRAIPTSKMPWEAFREMTDSDLRSVFRFLKSLPPTQHYIGASWRKASEDPTKDASAPQASR